MNIKRALISVWDKTNIAWFARALSERGVHISATLGTATYLRSQGINVEEISEITGYSETLEGNIKSIHPKVFAAILMNLIEEEHVRLRELFGVEPFDMVVVNPRPFQIDDTLDEQHILRSIDVGGIAMLRAAAKNYRNVVPVCDPKDYDMIIESIDKCGDVELQKRRYLCVKAFLFCHRYDENVFRTLCDLFAIDEAELRKG